MCVLIDKTEVCGKSEKRIDFSSFEMPVHEKLLEPIKDLKKAANENGFSLCIASGYRDFNRQLSIWNAKASNKRPVLDKNEQQLNLDKLTDSEKVFAILRWSALPGTSRHHWGTDIDVYDTSKIDKNYKLKLTVDECVNEGPFAEFHQWLEKNYLINSEGFFRPYAIDRGGVAPEPWHLSYEPLAKSFQKILSIDLVRENIIESDILLKDAILENLDEIYDRFVIC